MLPVLLLLAVSSQSISAADSLAKAWSILEDAIGNKSIGRRSEGVQALGLIQGNRKANALAEKALSDPEADVRVAAATTLGQMKDLGAKPQLEAAVDDKDLKVVLAAAGALFELRDPAAYQVYYAVLTGKRKSSEGLVRTQLDLLHNRKEIERIAFETGIGFVPYAGIGWDVWRQLSSDHGSSVRAVAAEKLAKDPDPKSAEALVQASQDDDWRVRASVANAIGRRGDPRLLASVSSMLVDTNQSVRLQAAASVIVLTSRKGKSK